MHTSYASTPSCPSTAWRQPRGRRRVQQPTVAGQHAKAFQGVGCAASSPTPSTTLSLPVCLAPVLPPCLASSSSSSAGRRTSVIAHAGKGTKVRFICRECGFVHTQRQGKCNECSKFNTLEKREVLPEVGSSAAGGVGRSVSNRVGSQSGRSMGWVGSGANAIVGAMVDLSDPDSLLAVEPQSLRSLGRTRHTRPSRLVLQGRTGEEVNRVLGGGVVPGSLVLVGGDPGVGKSTLLLQIAGMLAAPGLNYDALIDSGLRSQQQQLAQQHIATGQTHQQQLEQQRSQGQNGAGQQGEGHSRRGRRAGSVAGSGARMGLVKLESDEEDEEMEEDGVGDSEDEGEGAARDPGRLARRVLYVSGEEMTDQVYDRAARMGLGDCSSLYVISDYRMEVVCKLVYEFRPAALVVDSINTMCLAELNKPAGNVVQLVECCNCLKQLAQNAGMAVFTIGHMTKNNQIGGPKAMMHMVDVVLRLEEDMSQAFRMLRADKNRNGNTSEMGVFSMEPGGMRAVEDLSAQFLASRSASSVSSALTVTMDSSRPLAMEVQALVTGQHPQSQSPPIRQPCGVNRERLAPIIVSVLHKFVLPLHNQNIVVSITGGMQMREPAADLAIAVAIVSGYYSKPVPRDMVVIGEIDLGGGLRPVKSLDTRLAEVAKLGVKSAVIPKPHYPDELSKLRRDTRLQGLDLLPCSTLLEALQMVLGHEVGQRKSSRRQAKKGESASRSNGKRRVAVSEMYDDTGLIDSVDEEAAESAGSDAEDDDGDDDDGYDAEEQWEREMARA